MTGPNQLYYGDNLDVMRRHIVPSSVDLIYLDPPFNSDRNYNVIFNRHSVAETEAVAQIQAFEDTWVWTTETEKQYETAISTLPNQVADAVTAIRGLLGENDAMAYLVNMAPRLVEMHRALKPTGSLYLHCDPTMSHYLKVLLDTVFGPANFRNEVIWHYKTFHGNTKKWFPKKHDTLPFYSKSNDWYFKQVFADDYEETIDFKRWRAYLVDGNVILGANMPMQDSRFTRYYRRWVRQHGREPDADDIVLRVQGQAADTVWDIKAVDPKDKDRLGYPTQKPIALLERIIEASCPEDGVVLDPFCGCGTSLAAAQRLGRRWVGIYITYLAVDLIDKRLKDTYGDEVDETYEVLGIPRDLSGAYALFSRSPFDFERWAVSLVHGTPNSKQVGDRGIDGVARFRVDPGNARRRNQYGRVLISVKGGAQLNPSMVRDLLGTVTTEKAEMGLLLTMQSPTRGMVDAVNHAGLYRTPWGATYPRLQIVTVPELLGGKRPDLPGMVTPYIAAQRQVEAMDTEAMF